MLLVFETISTQMPLRLIIKAKFCTLLCL